MKKMYYVWLLCLACISCGTDKVETVVTEVPALRASKIYYSSEVYDYLQQYKDSHKEIAASYLKKAEAVLKTDRKKALYYYKRAITLYPSFDTYKAVAELAMEDGDYEEALRAYSILVYKANYKEKDVWKEAYLFIPPDEDLLYEFVLAGILANDALDYYLLDVLNRDELDMQDIKKRLLSDARFKYDTSGLVYKNIMIQFWSQEEIEAYKTSAGNFHMLLSSIKDTSSVFTIDQRSVQQFNYNDFNGMNYDEEGGLYLTDMMVYYLKEKQDNPDNWLRYNFNRYLQPNAAAKVMVYAIDTSAVACPIEMRHIYHHLVVYDAKGQIIDDKIIASQAGDQVQTVSYRYGTFEITDYKRTWKKPYNKNDFDNEIIKTELVSKKTYQINADGKIVEVVQAEVL